MAESSKKTVGKSEMKRKLCALVVDDEHLIRRIHGMMLNKLGLETDTTENGKKAVDLFASGKCYDLVLMDMEMPVMDGAKATEELRGMGVRSMIVGVTACHLEAQKEAFVKAGLDYCWEKPLTSAKIILLLEELANKMLSNSPSENICETIRNCVCEK